MSQEARNHVLELEKNRQKIEEEIKHHISILKQNGVGMEEPLVDSEGYPLNSIDIYQVRNSRQKIICLKNDLKELMKNIESGITEYYSSTSLNSSNKEHKVSAPTEHVNLFSHKEPFSRVDVVTQGSPADCAGLMNGDEIVEFGSVNSTNFKNINDIVVVVQHSEDKPVNVKLKRGDIFATVQLIPRKWKGKGLLGCSIVPLK